MINGPFIFQTIKALWAAQAALRAVTLLPWEKTPSEDDSAANAPPYANIRVTPGGKEWNSGPYYLQKYTLEIKLFVVESSASLEALATAAGSAIDFESPTGIMLIIPETEELAVAPEEYQGQTLQTSVLKWTVLCQQMKG